MCADRQLFIVQKFIFQSFQFGTSENLYYRINDKVTVFPSCEKFLFDKGGRVSFDTYFNALTIHKWKKYCQVNKLFVRIEGKGHFVVRFCIHQQGKHSTILEENILNINEKIDIEINNWKELKDGLLFLDIKSLEDNGEINNIAFMTDTVPDENVKLGIVVTHFNRKQWVLPAVKRLNEQLFSDAYYQNKIHLVIVDNSQNLSSDEVGQATLLPNRNLGGSGGFTRGLLYLKDSNQDYTHCLFMDDDASCEVESIRRTYNFISFLNDDYQNMAISGALLQELHPSIMYEKGAKFSNKHVIGLYNNLNMDLIEHVLRVEDETLKPNYGAWWFFCFPIDNIKHYPFPFFVRGDDILFSLSNKFNILTLNGISCWGEDFAYKDSPLTKYLDARANAMIAIFFHNVDSQRAKKIYKLFFKNSLNSMNYDSCQAILWSMQDFLLGPDFLVNNLDTQNIRSKIKEISTTEKLRNLDIDQINIVHRSSKSHKENKIHKLLRNLTLNGLLLPMFLRKKQMVYQTKFFQADAREVFRYNTIYYEYLPTHEGYIVKFDRKKAFTLLKEYIATSFLFNKRFNSVKKQYQEKFDYMTSEKFWRDVYK